MKRVIWKLEDDKIWEARHAVGINESKLEDEKLEQRNVRLASRGEIRRRAEKNDGKLQQRDL